MSEERDWAGIVLRLEQLVADEIEHGARVDLDQTLQTALGIATELAPCDVGSVSLRHHDGTIETTAASGPVADQAHQLQQKLGEGPCLAATWGQGDVYVVTDLADDQRWPRWGPAAAELGLASMLAVRLFTVEDTLGALDLYSFQPRGYTGDDVQTAQIVATRVSAALAHARQELQLWQAIDARNHIGQAQGILMERYGISAEQAFAVLRRYSQDNNTKLRTIADRLITDRDLPPDQ